MKRFVISDHHFFHANIIKYCDRPFSDVPEMNEFMIERWNEIVTPDNEVYYIGDFGLGSIEKLQPIFLRLNGIKYLVRGNHDPSHKKCKELGWVKVFDKLTIESNGAKILLIHRPWAKETLPSYISLVIHGHIHNNPTPRPHLNLNVSVEVLNYQPAELDVLVKNHLEKYNLVHVH